ncbi:trypsin-7-like [Onthophagus taurus]|uniref:trypsin-7-like n=1 Tax=Onthophagus taurus TaxID=166361 RepID=UPI000C202462|nr:trypsin-7-like [Onthophagus taurus]
MLKLIILLLCVYAVAADRGFKPIVPTLDGRIVGGQTVNIANFPYQVSLRLGTSHFCGAVIIGTNWAVTAAHCLVGVSGTFSIRSGSSMANSGGTIHSISRLVVHGSYNSRTLDFDIALAQISGSFALGSTGVQRINLPSAGSRPSAGTNAVVSGWGAIREGGPGATQLQAVTVPIVSQASCRSSYGTSAITDRMICAGFASGGRDACQGDSGGPLAVGNTLVGVVSWGRGCARPNFPGVYACTGNLRNWIAQISGI